MKWESERRAAIRAVERLRSGLPPDEGAEAITVGMADLRTSLGQVLADEGSTHIRGIAIVGVYGAGKTHSLTLVRDTARKRGYATAWLSADSAECSLNHPQRFIGAVLASLEFHGEGIRELITSLLATEDGIDRVDAAALEVFWTEAYLDSAVRNLLEILRLRGEDEDDTGFLEAQQQLLWLLSGDSLAASPGTTNFRAAAYRLLEFTERVVRMQGARGLVIVIDEVESVFTKLHNRLSRRGAFRVLAALLRGLEAPGLRIAMGVTDDGWSWLTDSPDLDEASSCTVHEDVSQLPDALGDIPVVECKPLDARDLAAVLDRVKLLHGAVYGAACPQSQWVDRRRHIIERRPGPRIAIRDAVDFLDAFRFAPP